MTYHVLARKWRPKTFNDVVGQEHVLKALINALNQQRLHHAYLFTGTRGVGKTTIARIIAKCLNCEKGISSHPCDVCSTCQMINEGRFVDLIEVDAASRTRVEETRELLDNVQYAPTQGRFKLYLIDEIHMLSGHSFNALLKTLEEPPAHVKFLLATTDPQRLPITVLSRCLQFHLKCLTPELIQNHLQSILQSEGISFESESLALLAHAANGSVRDALSLLDQAIAYCNGLINTVDIRAMLGTIEQTYLFEIMAGLDQHNVATLLAISNQLAERAADFANVLEELLLLLHHIAITQFIPHGFAELSPTYLSSIQQLSAKFSKETIQLYYQIGLIGRRDLALAPSQKSGFEMVLLRMLTFQPADINSDPTPMKNKPQQMISTTNPIQSNHQLSESISNTSDIHQWQLLIESLSLTGMTKELAQCCSLKSLSDSLVELVLDPIHEPLLNPNVKGRLQQALSQKLNKEINLVITIGDTNVMTPVKYQQLEKTQQHTQAMQVLASDPYMQSLLNTFDGRLHPESVATKKDKL